MKICVAQIRPVKGNMATNIENHKRLIGLATSLNANAIFFPELSITSYEPELAKDLLQLKTTRGLTIFSKLVTPVTLQLVLVFQQLQVQV